MRTLFILLLTILTIFTKDVKCSTSTSTAKGCSGAGANVDADLSEVVLPYTISNWVPTHPLGTETLLCPSNFTAPKNASLDLSKSTIFKWIAPNTGSYQIRSLHPDNKVQVRFMGCGDSLFFKQRKALHQLLQGRLKN